MEGIKPILIFAQQNAIFKLVIALVVMDVIFGCLRAIKEKQFNSSVGINGMIRKAGMLISLVCMIYLDRILELNLIGFIPEGVLQYLPLKRSGIMEFFAVIYAVYEVLSVLKNMALSGLPVEKIWKVLKNFLQSNTSEIIDINDDEEKKEG